ncbi:hypothetical protein GCM10011348_25750 [Marinobacterium nitratireducens]|uniref:Uncharacterized protein n=1 Tax=Marinobacterium nitratireducens TaxID=518897 RepID=A0A917ZGS8_9GAMM|nr:hypothetical protein [Marinobacterium nitratireducens]GGO83015.1 hypothetical protein GCM10011348_25750 [Marinobacterium nitratireducens]
MPTSHVSELLDALESKARLQESLTDLNVTISKEDLVRLEALACAFGLSREDVCSSLLHSILMEVEAKMPYRPGPKVIRIEDGDPIYEDVGPMPRYLEAKRRLEKEQLDCA